MLEKALELATRIRDPYSVLAVGLIIIYYLFVAALKKKSRITWVLAVSVIVISVFPFLASAYLASRGMYHIRVIVLGIEGQPVTQADLLSSSSGGEFKKASGNWEFDLAPQGKPSSDEVEFYASVKDQYLAGSSSLSLKRNYFPTVTIQLSPLPAVMIRGTVVDEVNKSVPGAQVAIPGYSYVATTDQMGNFSLPSHHAEGQSLSIRAEKGDRVAEQMVIAGSTVRLVLIRR